jgi:hypothetical protein
MKEARDILKIAKSLLSAEKQTIGDIEFEAVRKDGPRGKYWIYKVGRKEFDHMTYSTKEKMWDDLRQIHRVYNDEDRWKRSFKAKNLVSAKFSRKWIKDVAEEMYWDMQAGYIRDDDDGFYDYLKSNYGPDMDDNEFIDMVGLVDKELKKLKRRRK